MDVELRTVTSRRDLDAFGRFPWEVNRGDPCWVPPLMKDRRDRLDPAVNPFWKKAEREVWVAWRGKQPVGTIAAIHDQSLAGRLRQPTGFFGFFDCLDDPAAAAALLDQASAWAAARGARILRGPYNPGGSDEPGVLVEGYQTRPAIMEGHNPPYYAALLESAGFVKFEDILARLGRRPPQARTFEEAVPEKLLRAAQIVRRRPDVTIRPIRLNDWEAEIRMAARLFNTALEHLPDYLPVSEEEFLSMAASFRPILDARMALVAEVGGKPVGFTLALPDVNEALKHLNGRLGLPGLVRMWWHSRHLQRVSFKILIMSPEYHFRGIEAALVAAVARAIWDAGYTEIDMSLTGEENISSTLYQANLGFPVYRRYRVYERPILAAVEAAR